MSKLGHWNYHNHPERVDAIVRSITLRRDDERFFSDAGTPGPTPAAAYELGYAGPDLEFPTKPRGYTFNRFYPGYRAPIPGKSRVVQPALPVDCIRPYEAGAAIAEVDREELARTESDYYDSYGNDLYDLFEASPYEEPDPFDPTVHASDAWLQAENDAGAQKMRSTEQMWKWHERGCELAPQFLSRVVELPVRGAW